MPQSIGDFRLTGTQRLDSASGGGFLLRYARADTLRADVFVYPGPDFATDCPVVCAQRALADEGDGFVREIPVLIERRFLDSATVRSDSALVTPAGALWRLGRHIALDAVRNGAPVRSDLFLFYIDRVRVKVRATYRGTPAFVAAIEQLAAATVAALIGPTVAGDRPPR